MAVTKEEIVDAIANLSLIGRDGIVEAVNQSLKNGYSVFNGC